MSYCWKSCCCWCSSSSSSKQIQRTQRQQYTAKYKIYSDLYTHTKHTAQFECECQCESETASAGDRWLSAFNPHTKGEKMWEMENDSVPGFNGYVCIDFVRCAESNLARRFVVCICMYYIYMGIVLYRDLALAHTPKAHRFVLMSVAHTERIPAHSISTECQLVRACYARSHKVSLFHTHWYSHTHTHADRFNCEPNCVFSTYNVLLRCARVRERTCSTPHTQRCWWWASEMWWLLYGTAVGSHQPRTKHSIVFFIRC